MQVVGSVASGSKFCWLLPDKRNTDYHYHCYYHLHYHYHYHYHYTTTLQKRALWKTWPVRSGIPIRLCKQKQGFKGHFKETNNSHTFRKQYRNNRSWFALIVLRVGMLSWLQRRKYSCHKKYFLLCMLTLIMLQIV